MNSLRTYLTTGITALLLVGLLFFVERVVPSIRDIDVKGRDIFFRLHHDLFPPPSEADEIVLVNLDDETLRRLGLRWPYPRSLYAEALRRLQPFAPKTVGFDLIFSGADLTLESDETFAAALQEMANVVIASHRDLGGEVGPSDLIRQSVWRVGIVGKPRDRDRLLRRIYLWMSLDGQTHRSWELELFAKAFSEETVKTLPVDQEAVINYRLRFNEFRQISFWRLLEGSVLAEELKDKIVLIGLTAEAFHDIHATPLGSMPGLAVNANALLMLMSREFFSYSPKWITALLSFLSFWVTLLIALSSGTVFGFLFVTFLIVIFLVASFLLFSSHVILDFWLVSVAIVLTLVGAALYREWQLFLENLRLREESARDPLTGFYNRRFLGLKLKLEFNRLFSRRGFKSGFEISVVMLDLDNFKLVNDSFGHAEGDRVLATMAEAIRSSVRKDELICRYGGDEFCVILPNTAIQDAAKFGEKIRSLIANNPDLVYRTASGVDTIRVTASVGVASVAVTKATDSTKLLKAADRALYRAKTGGRNQVCVFDAARDVIE